MKKHPLKKSLKEDEYSKHLVSINAKSFSSHNIIQDFSFNDDEYRHAKTIHKIFGNNKFIKAFLKLVFPSLFWGLFTALVPILFNTLINGFYQDSQIGNQLYLSVNYTAYLFGYLNPLAASFIFAAFPAIGNYIGRNDKRKLQEVLRWTTYISLLVCIAGLVLEEAFAMQIALVLVWQYQAPVTGVDLIQTNYSITLIRWFAGTSFFYVWLWLYVPTLSSMKNSRALFYSSVVGFIYFLVAYPSYLSATFVNTGNEVLANASAQSQLYGVVNGIGGIYLGYYIIQPLFLLIYTYFPREFKVWEAEFFNFFIVIWNGLNKISREYQANTRAKIQKFPKPYIFHSTNKEEYSDYERDMLFFQTGFKVTYSSLKQIMILAWAILLDQLFYSALNLVLTVYGTNFHGYWDGWNNITVSNPELSLHMAKEYYKLILANVSLISSYIFTVYNGFSLLPQYFVAYYLGNGDKQTAYHNSTILTNWGVAFGLFLAMIIVIYGSFINEVIYASPDGHSLYYFTYKGHEISLGSYQDIWQASFNMELIYALAVLFDTGVAMTYYILVAGGSKFIVLADSFIQLINALALLALYYTNYNDFYVYYLVNRIHTFLKFAVGFIVIYMRGALWGIDNQYSKSSWFRQKIISRLEPDLKS